VKRAFNLDKRLRDIEGINPASGVILHFENGSTRLFKIHKNSVLGLFVAASNLFHWSSFPDLYTCEKRGEQAARRDVARDPSDREDPETGRPITKFDPLLEMLARATHITGPAAHHLVAESWGLMRLRAEVLRRGQNFFFSRENPDPFFKNYQVGPLTGREPQQLSDAGVHGIEEGARS